MAEFVLIPDGPKNLSILFPDIDWREVAEYNVEVVDVNGNVMATTPVNVLQGCCTDDKMRLHFLNYLGTFDAVNFRKPKIAHEGSSSEYQRGLPDVLQKSSTGLERYNVKSNDTKEARTDCYGEEDMKWLQELADTPKAFEEWKGTQGQNDDIIPVRVLDGKFDKQKNDQEYTYPFIVTYKMSNEFKTIRN